MPEIRYVFNQGQSFAVKNAFEALDSAVKAARERGAKIIDERGKVDWDAVEAERRGRPAMGSILLGGTGKAGVPSTVRRTGPKRKTNIRRGQTWKTSVQIAWRAPGSAFRVVSVGQRTAVCHFVIDESRFDLLLEDFEAHVRSGNFTLWVDLDRLDPVGQHAIDREKIRELSQKLNDATQRLDSVGDRLYHAEAEREKAINEALRLQARLTESNQARLADRKPLTDALAEERAKVERLEAHQKDYVAKFNEMSGWNRDAIAKCRQLEAENRKAAAENAELRRAAADVLVQASSSAALALASSIVAVLNAHGFEAKEASAPDSDDEGYVGILGGLRR